MRNELSDKPQRAGIKWELPTILINIQSEIWSVPHHLDGVTADYVRHDCRPYNKARAASPNVKYCDRGTTYRRKEIIQSRFVVVSIDVHHNIAPHSFDPDSKVRVG